MFVMVSERRQGFGWRLLDELETVARNRVSAATFDEHEGDTIVEHRFVNVLSPS
jgi:ribosomal protein S18 acetylase RimI-like enzyme